MQEAWDNIQKFEDCVVLTKVGGFYELYFEQAQEYGPLLNLKVALKKIVGGSVPMVGHLEASISFIFNTDLSK